jgi:hypothetical protein
MVQLLFVIAVAHAAPEMHVLHIQGTATYDKKPIRRGEALKSGGWLEVDAAPDSFVDLMLADGHEFRLKNKTKLKLSGEGPAGPTEAQLLYGKVFAMFAKKPSAQTIQLKTKTAVAGVRGTKFLFEWDEVKGTYVCVCDGVVHVEATGPRAGDGAVDVSKNQDIWVAADKKMGQPITSDSMGKMTAAEFKSMESGRPSSVTTPSEY